MKKAFGFSMVIIFLQLAAALLLFRYLPEQIPVHWNMRGVIDGYGSRSVIFIAPVASLVVTLLLYLLPKIDPKGENIKRSGQILPLLMIMINLLMTALLVLMAVSAFGTPVPTATFLFVLIGVMLLLMGNYLPKVKPNYSLGIRLPWTLASEDVWVKTHRVGGWVFFVSGLLFIVGAFLPGMLGVILPTAVLLVGLIVMTVYAYRLYQKQTEG